MIYTVDKIAVVDCTSATDMDQGVIGELKPLPRPVWVVRNWLVRREAV